MTASKTESPGCKNAISYKNQRMHKSRQIYEKRIGKLGKYIIGAHT